MEEQIKNVPTTGQVLTFYSRLLGRFRKKLKEILNNKLSKQFKIKKNSEVNDNFHVRFSAKKRVYRYIITSKPTTPFNDKFVTYIKYR